MTVKVEKARAYSLMKGVTTRNPTYISFPSVLLSLSASLSVFHFSVFLPLPLFFFKLST